MTQCFYYNRVVPIPQIQRLSRTQILSRATKTYASCANSGELVKETSESAAVHAVFPMASELNLTPKASSVTWYPRKRKRKNGRVPFSCTSSETKPGANG